MRFQTGQFGAVPDRSVRSGSRPVRLDRFQTGRFGAVPDRLDDDGNTDTVGCNFVERFGPPGCRNVLLAYSRQYELPAVSTGR